jgi:hypothetical protein
MTVRYMLSLQPKVFVWAGVAATSASAKPLLKLHQCQQQISDLLICSSLDVLLHWAAMHTPLSS